MLRQTILLQSKLFQDKIDTYILNKVILYTTRCNNYIIHHPLDVCDELSRQKQHDDLQHRAGELEEHSAYTEAVIG